MLAREQQEKEAKVQASWLTMQEGLLQMKAPGLQKEEQNLERVRNLGNRQGMMLQLETLTGLLMAVLAQTSQRCLQNMQIAVRLQKGSASFTIRVAKMSLMH